MGGGEGVIHIKIAKACKGLGKGRIIGFFARMEAHIFQQDNACIFNKGLLGRLANAIRGKSHRLAKSSHQSGQQGLETHLRHHLPFGAAKMG